MLRAGNAGSNTAAEHIEVTKLALAHAPQAAAPGADPHRFRRRHPRLPNLAGQPVRRLHYSVGMTITEDMAGAILALPERIWEPAYDAEGQVRRGAWVAELTGLLDLGDWPAGMRVIVRREPPHPGAQLRFTDYQWAPVHRLRY